MTDAARLLFTGALLVVLTGPVQMNGQAGGRGARSAGGEAARTREFLGLGPAPDAAAAKKGEPLFKQNCGGCHGENGRGAQGPNLVRSVTVLHDEKGEQIGAVVRNGRPGMPPFPALSQDDINNISQFLHLQVELAANRGTYGQNYSELTNQVTGDPRQGEAFFKANCTRCHSATGDLARIGSKFKEAQQLRARFLWPAPEGPVKATVTSASGEKVTGAVLRNDDFNLSLRDAAGEYHSWPKDQIKVDIPDPMAAHRALLAKYSNADIHNMTAYLVTLK
jgi:cytochrome c oxidase cbb3-type subunit III